MLDLKQIREAPEAVRERLARRDKPDILELIDQVVAADEERRALIAEVDALRARRNEVSPEVGRLKQAGANAEAEVLVAEMKAVGEQLRAGEQRLAEIEAQVRSMLLLIPNLTEEDVPAGGPEANVVVRETGADRAVDFAPRPHWDIAESLRLLDFPRGAKIAGSGFPVYIGAGARLERALIQFMLDLHTREHGYTEVSPPLLVNHQAAIGTGHLPRYAEEMYEVPLDGLFLVPTAELPLTNLHAGELLPPDSLPIRYVAYTPCFRREAGAHGKDTRGLLRLHQFDKVELMRFETPENSAAALEELTSQAEEVLRRLGLRYRVLLLAAGDTGFANAKTYDLEVWSPGVQRWLEVSSCSLYRDYQARRANIRYRAAARAAPEYVHTLNGSALGLARTLTAVIEAYQRADGTLAVPDVLVPYVGAELIS